MSSTTTHGTGALPLTPIALAVSNLTVIREHHLGRPVTVIGGITFAVAPGECLAIVGSSGAGKSVLARTLLGLADPTGGAHTGWRVSARNFEVAGTDMRRASQREWRKLRGSEISLVLQDALQSLDPLRTIEAEVAEALALRGVPKRERRALTLRALEAAGLTHPESLLSARSTALSGGMRQRALIAGALVGNPAVLVADEPTTALDPSTARQVLDEFARVRDAGTAVVMVSHDLGAVTRVADRIMVLEAGRVVESGNAQQLLNQPSHPATVALVDAIPRQLKRHPRAAASPEGKDTTEVLATLTGVTRSYGARGGEFTGIRDVNLVINRGEIVGVAGDSGAGKTTLARLIAGAEPADEGTLALTAGVRVRMIPQDPLATFDPRWKVRRILTATLARAGHEPGRAPTPAALLRRVGLNPNILDRKPATLSGGERQRVAIARALAARPDILVCDEAVSALDTVTQSGVLRLLQDLSRDTAVVFVSHDLGALASIADRILVVRDGRVASDAEAAAFLDVGLGGSTPLTPPSEALD